MGRMLHMARSLSVMTLIFASSLQLYRSLPGVSNQPRLPVVAREHCLRDRRLAVGKHFHDEIADGERRGKAGAFDAEKLD